MEKPVSVMIADSSESFRKLLGEYINAEEDMFVAASAENGAEAARLAEELHPDVLVTGLLLRELEGLDVLRRLRERESMPYTIVVSSFVNNSVAEMASELGVVRFFLKPCRIETIIESVRFSRGRAREEMSKQVERAERERKVEDALLDCGFNPYLLGWRYLKEALLEAWEDGEILEGVTKRLYPELARRFGTSSANLERCIRSAVEGAWRDGDSRVRDEFFGKEMAPMLGKKPGNTKFMKLLLERLRKSGI